MLATSKVFEKTYLLELAYWSEGMPLEIFNDYLRRYGYAPLPKKAKSVEVQRIYSRDIPELGKEGLKVLSDIGIILSAEFDECTGCESCVASCMEGAIKVERTNDHYKIVIRSELCDGMACLRCQQACPQGAFKYQKLLH